MLTPKKCCFCLPLRKGLLCIGYVRLAICLATIAQLAFMCLGMVQQMQDSYEDAVTFLKSVASIIPQLLDLVFTLTFIVAAHKKTRKLFEVYYLYCITMVLVYSLVVTLVVLDMQRFDMLYYMIFQYAWFINGGYLELVGLGIVVIVLQIYVTLLVRSETYHLKEKNKADFLRQRSSASLRLPRLNRMESNRSIK